MHAIIQDELGGPEVLHPATVAKPQPGLGQVLLRVSAAGINPADAMNRQVGAFQHPLPFILGWDVSGTVEAVGPGVTLYAPGDDVFGMLPFPGAAGAYAEYVVAPTRALVRKPQALSHAEAAALPLAGLTAWQALVDTAGVTEGTRVLITGASGGVGHIAVQIAAARGAHVIALASAANEQLVRELGATEVVDYTTTDFSQVLSDVDVVLEVLGTESAMRAVTVLRPGGILVSTLPQSLGPVVSAAQDKGIRLAGLFVEADQIGLNALSELVTTGKLAPRIAASYPLDEAAMAHATKHAPGKVVLLVE